MAFIFCNGAFHGGIFAWLGLLLTSRYHLHDTGIGLALAGYGLPGHFLRAHDRQMGRPLRKALRCPLRISLGCCMCVPIASSQSRFVAALPSRLCRRIRRDHPLMSSITTSLDPKHRGQITGLATFANFLGMGAGALCFQQLIAFGFTLRWPSSPQSQTLLGIAALHEFRGERPSRARSVELTTT